MNKMYRIFILCLSMIFVGFLAAAQAQEIGDIVWEDHFDDPVNDYLLNNVGWMYFGEEDGLVGQEVSQTEEGTAWIKSGIFSTVIGASIIQTNGVDYIDPNDYDGSIDRIKKQNPNVPANQDLTFQVNFTKFTLVEGGTYPMGTFFILGTRMFNPDTGRGYGDPIEDSTYVLYISPLTDQVNVAKFWGDLAVLNPAGWTYFAEPASYDFDLNVPYWVEFYLYEGDLKVKIWEGDLADGALEPWLIEVTDPEPWVRGTFTEFGMLGDPLVDGDEMELDNIVMREITAANALETVETTLPAKFALANNYPNPFNPQTTIEFSLEKTSEVTLTVYSITGQLVRTLVNSNMEAGSHQVTFNGRDDLGHALASGVYFYQLQTTDNIATQKMILMK
jgi:hypothetical protein